MEMEDAKKVEARVRKAAYMREYRRKHRKRLRRYNRNWMWARRNIKKKPSE